MARKKSSGDASALNLDSLMDALTNVVAVLIFVLLLVNVDVTKKIVEFTEGIEPATEEDIQRSKNELSIMELQQRDLQGLLAETPPTPAELEAIKRENDQIKIQVSTKTKENITVNKALEELKLLLATVKTERDQERQKTVALQEEIRRLESLLDKTPVVTGPPPLEIKIPYSRQIPDNAVIYTAMVKNDRIHIVAPLKNYSDIVYKIMDSKKKDINDLILEKTEKGKEEIITYDQVKLINHFTDFDFQPPPGQKIEVKSDSWHSFPTLWVTPDFKNDGTTKEQLSQANNPFKDSLKKIRSNNKAVLIFHVSPESFNTYLAAREIVDEMRIPAGWQSMELPFLRDVIRNIKVKPTATPPPSSKVERPPTLAPRLD